MGESELEIEIGGVRLLWCPIEKGRRRGDELTARQAERQAVDRLVARAFPQGQYEYAHFPSGAPVLEVVSPSSNGSKIPTISVSHSRRFAVLAVDPLGRNIGVDIEERSRQSQLQRVASRFLSEMQLVASPSLPEAWTQKEALYKALHAEGLDLRSLPIGYGRLRFQGRSFLCVSLPLVPPDLAASLVVEH